MGGLETKERELMDYAEYLWAQAQRVKRPVLSVDTFAHGFLFGSVARGRQNLEPDLSLGEHYLSLDSDADVLIQPSSRLAFIAFCYSGEKIFRNMPIELDFSLVLTFEAPFIKRASQYWIQLF